jgi:hypothetical protein
MTDEELAAHRLTAKLFPERVYSGPQLVDALLPGDIIRQGSTLIFVALDAQARADYSGWWWRFLRLDD